MPAKLYSLSLSHPAQTARLMLERKRIEHEVVDLLPGMQPLAVRLAGFRGSTVPALRIDGRRVLGSLQIARYLEELEPDPPLYPSDPERRRAVERAERWGEAELQPIPRRLFRWAATHSRQVREWVARDVVGMPLPRVMAAANMPVAWALGKKVGVTDARVREDIESLPRTLDRVDELIGAGTIGAPDPNAADLQISTSVRSLLTFSELRGTVEHRPCAELARRILAELPEPVPPAFPSAWLESMRAAGTQATAARSR